MNNLNFNNINQNDTLLVVLGFIFFAIACYPGFMSPDSLVQFEQSQTLKFTDGHPPVMAWFWSKLNYIYDGPQSLFFMHLFLLWYGLYIWRKNAGDVKYARWFIILGFLPWVANFQGTLWKDVELAFSLMLALGLLGGKVISKPQIFFAIVLMTYAFMVRTNAPAALIPVIWFASIKLLPSISNRIHVLNVIFAFVLLFGFSNFFTYSIVEAKKDNLASFMMVDDLVNLSVVAEKSLLPRVDLKTVKECSQELVGDTKLAGRLVCLNGKETYKSVAPIPYQEIKDAWKVAVKNYPLESLKFRLDVYLNLLRNPSSKPYIYWFSGVYPNNMGIVQKDNYATVLLKRYVNGVSKIAPFLFKPYWWAIIALLILLATLRMEGDQNSITLIRVLISSALLYILSYLPFAPMADFRYVYWSTLAISLAFIKFFTSNVKIYTNKN